MAFVGSTNIVDILIQRGAIKMWLNLGKGELDDPKKIARDVSSVGHWGNGDYEIKLLNDNDFEYILSLIKQSYRKNK
jgi:predicted transport protein